MSRKPVLPSDLALVSGVAILGVIAALGVSGLIPGSVSLVISFVGLPLVLGYALWVHRHRDEAPKASTDVGSPPRTYIALMLVIIAIGVIQIVSFVGSSPRLVWSLLAAAALGGGFWLWFWIKGDA